MSIRNIIGGKSSAVSKMLNIVGMAMAFAALYVIMVQVNFDLGYKKKSRIRIGFTQSACQTGTLLATGRQHYPDRCARMLSTMSHAWNVEAPPLSAKAILRNSLSKKMETAHFI